jgi:hypothetical protein
VNVDEPTRNIFSLEERRGDQSSLQWLAKDAGSTGEMMVRRGGRGIILFDEYDKVYTRGTDEAIRSLSDRGCIAFEKVQLKGQGFIVFISSNETQESFLSDILSHETDRGLREYKYTLPIASEGHPGGFTDRVQSIVIPRVSGVKLKNIILQKLEGFKGVAVDERTGLEMTPSALEYLVKQFEDNPVESKAGEGDESLVQLASHLKRHSENPRQRDVMLMQEARVALSSAIIKLSANGRAFDGSGITWIICLGDSGKLEAIPGGGRTPASKVTFISPESLGKPRIYIRTRTEPDGEDQLAVALEQEGDMTLIERGTYEFEIPDDWKKTGCFVRFIYGKRQIPEEGEEAFKLPEYSNGTFDTTTEEGWKTSLVKWDVERFPIAPTEAHDSAIARFANGFISKSDQQRLKNSLLSFPTSHPYICVLVLSAVVVIYWHCCN